MEKLDLKKLLEKKIPKILENSWDRLRGDFAEKYYVIKEKYKDNGINNLDYCLSYTIEDYLDNEFINYDDYLNINETNAFLKKELEEFGIEYKLNIYLEKNHCNCLHYCEECNLNRYNNEVTCSIEVTSYNDKILKEYQEIFKKCFSLFEDKICKNHIERIRKDKIDEVKKSYENIVNLYFDNKLTEDGLSRFISLFKSVENDIEEDLKNKYNNFIKKII